MQAEGRKAAKHRGVLRPIFPEAAVFSIGSTCALRRILDGLAELVRKLLKALIGCMRGKPCRWAVERTNSWHNLFRGLIIRYDRKGANYLALLHLASGLIPFQQARRR